MDDPRPDDTTIAPDPTPAEPPAARTFYDRDFYSWALEQARLIRAGDFAAVDVENVAEEIESLGREQFNKLESAFRVLLVHILKWDFQPERRSRSWALSITEQRLVLEDVLDDNPGLKPRIPEAIDRAYRKARVGAARETKRDARAFPTVCPYTLEDITARPFEHTPGVQDRTD